MMFEIADKAFSVLLTLVFAPIFIVGYIGGWVYGTAKYCFLSGYGISIAAAQDREKANQLERAINIMLSQTKQEGPEERSKLQ